MLGLPESSGYPILGDFRIPQGLGKKIAVIGVVIACLIVVMGSTGIVGAGQRGVLLRFGAPTGAVKDEGLYFKIPFAEEVILMSTQLQKFTDMGYPLDSGNHNILVVGLTGPQRPSRRRSIDTALGPRRLPA